MLRGSRQKDHRSHFVWAECATICTAEKDWMNDFTCAIHILYCWGNNSKVLKSLVFVRLNLKNKNCCSLNNETLIRFDFILEVVKQILYVLFMLIFI